MRYARRVISVVIVFTFCCAALSFAANVVPTMHLLLSGKDKVQLVKNFTGITSDWEPSSTVIFREELWFPAPSEEYGWELWHSDGTASGTRLAADINPGPANSYPFYLVVYKDALYFFAKDAAHGIELRKTFWDNALKIYRTELVKDIYAGTEFGIKPREVTELVVFEDFLFFVANDGVKGKEVWRSDGTAAGTVRVTDINPGSGDADPKYLTVLSTSSTGDKLVFSARVGIDDRELWKIEKQGSPATFNVSIVKDISPGFQSSNPDILYDYGRFTQLKGELYFSAKDGTHGRELWKTDGTSAGTVMIKDIMPGGGDGLDGDGANIFKEKLFFLAEDGGKQKLWRTDGTPEGTVEAYSPASVGDYSLLVNFSGVDGLYFSMMSRLPSSGEIKTSLLRMYWDAGSSSWKTVVVSDTYFAMPKNIVFPAREAAFAGGEVYFPCAYNMQEDSYEYGLCKTNGGQAVTEIKGGYPLDSTLVRLGFIPFKNRLYFFATDGEKKMMFLTLTP